jgi:hypothetical protein
MAEPGTAIAVIQLSGEAVSVGAVIKYRKHRAVYKSDACGSCRGAKLKVRLTKKLAQIFNDVDLTCVKEGETLELPARDAGLLLAAEWAVPLEESKADDRPKIVAISSAQPRAVAADRKRPKRSA